jgi:fumarylpyruvate hydrolase
MAMWCTIRTFAKHAIELGNTPPTEPIIFVKPASCLHTEGPLPVSGHPGEVHHEVECVVRLNQALEPEAVAVGLDLTDRAAQGELRAERLPWAKAKCFRASAVVGTWTDWRAGWDALVDPSLGLHLSLEVNGQVRQSTPLHEMSVTPAQQIAALQQWAPVEGGHLLFTGTPEGVGRLLPGDDVLARLTDGEGRVLSEISTRCD